METPESGDDPAGIDTENEFESVPAEEWIPHRPFDSADYLDREPPRYAEEEDGPEEPAESV